MKLYASLSFRLISAIFIIITTLIIVFGIYDYTTQSNILAEKQNKQLELIESRLKINLPALIWNFEESLFILTINSEQQSESVAYIEILDGEGATIAGSEGEQAGEAIAFNLTYVEDDEKNEVGSILLYKDNSAIQSELKNLTNKIILKGLLLVSLLITLIYVLLRRLILKPIEKIGSALENIAQGDGDLTLRLEVPRKDEIGHVAESFNDFVIKIQSLILSIQESATQGTAAAKNISKTISINHQGVITQQQETNQVASAITEMSATTNEISNDIELASTSASKASDDATAITDIIQELVTSINELSDHLAKTSEVIVSLENDVGGIAAILQVIRTIADQTNLLALNAAIEAARAGDLGRGFAVVADEVRTLATRTQSSTSEIEQTVQRLQTSSKAAVEVMMEGTERGQATAEHAKKSSSFLQNIQESTERINLMASQIAVTIKEQSNVAENLGESITSITNIGNNSLIEISSISDNAKEMEDNSRELRNLSRQFKVTDKY